MAPPMELRDGNLSMIQSRNTVGIAPMNDGMEAADPGENDGIGGMAERVRIQRLITASVLERLDRRLLAVRRIHSHTRSLSLLLIGAVGAVAFHMVHCCAVSGFSSNRTTTLAILLSSALGITAALAVWVAMSSYRWMLALQDAIGENRLAMTLLGNLDAEKA